MRMNTLFQIINSPTLNVVLTLLLLFQWYFSFAKERAIKNVLFAARITLNRNGEATSAIDILDAALATLDARQPFTEELKKLTKKIIGRFENIDKAELELVIEKERE